MPEFYSIILKKNITNKVNLVSPVFTSSGSNEIKYELVQKDSGFWIAGDKTEFEETFFEDEHTLIVLRGYILHDEIDYELNIAKQLLQFYRLSGSDIFKEFSGVYNLIILEKESQKLIITNDRLGIKPFYYYQDDDKFIFASDIKTIALSNQIKKEINWRAWGDIFNYGFIIGEKTPFEKIYSLPMSSVLTYQNENLEIKKYWTFNQIKINYKQSEKETIEKGVEILKNITKKYDKFIKYVELPLSGGYDSRCIACCFKYYCNIKFDTITSNLHAKGKKDVLIAKELSKALDVKNTQVSDNNIYRKYFIDMVYLVNGMSFEHLWTMSLQDSLAKDANTFDGLIVDMLLSGRRSVRGRAADRKIYNDVEIVKFFTSGKKIMANKCIEFFSEDIKKSLIGEEAELLKQIENINENRYKLKFLFLNNRLKNSVAIASTQIVGKCAKVFSFFSDNDFIEFALTSPPKYEVKRDLYLKILQKAFPEIMRIPTTNKFPLFYDTKKKILGKLKKLLMNRNFIKALNRIGIDLKNYKKFKFLESFPVFPLNKEEERYLLHLIEVLDFPKELDKKSLLNEINKKILSGEKANYLIIPIANFGIWYNLFYLGKPIDELKSL